MHDVSPFHVCRCVVLLAFASVLSLISYAQDGAAPPEVLHISDTVSVDVNLVTVPFTVLDDRGHVVRHLQQTDFQIYENGVLQKIAGFRSESDGQPVSIAMLIDSSYSVSRSLEVEKQAATRFFHLLLQSGVNRALAASFSNNTDILQDYTSNPDQLAKRIRGIHAGGGTRLIDSIHSMIEQTLSKQEGHRALIVISDGDDNLSRIPIAAVIELAKRHEITIYTVQVESELERLTSSVSIPYLDPSRGPAILKRLAEETGGCTFMAKKPDDFGHALQRIATALRAHYTIQYQSSRSAADGSYRSIRVAVDNPKYQVHSRNGYFPQATGSTVSVR